MAPLPVNTANTTLDPCLPGELPDPGYTFTEDLNKVWRSHTFKAGVYAGRNNKLPAATTSIRGSFNFGRDTSNPLDSGHGYANALLGNFNSYTEATKPAGRRRRRSTPGTTPSSRGRMPPPANGVQTDPNFGAYTSAFTPRNIQLSLRVMF